MKLPDLSATPRDMRIASEEAEDIGKAVKSIWERYAICDTYNDGREMQRVAQDIDALLPSLPELVRRFESVARPADDTEIGQMLAAVRINFHNSKAVGDYAAIMLERVKAKRPSYAALEWTARHFIDRARFMPVTAEVLEVLAHSQSRIASIRDILATLPARRERIGQAINDRGA
jgi:hypothetical protein